MSRVEQQSFWSNMVAIFRASGQSVSAWCIEQDVKPHQLRYWLRKEQASINTKTSWLPLDLNEAALQTSLSIKVGRVTIEVRPGFDPKLLLDVVKTLIAQ